MTTGQVYGAGSRMLTLDELCDWLNITERHARKLVERDAIPYRKVGHLLRFPEAEVEQWSLPAPKAAAPVPQQRSNGNRNANNSGNGRTRPNRRGKKNPILPKSLIE